jgi:predicted transcriptional regulator
MNDKDFEHLANSVQELGSTVSEYTNSANNTIATLLTIVQSLNERVDQLEKRQPTRRRWWRRAAAGRRPK